MKRLRSRISPQKIRYFMCGEYGDRFSRPHYHACVFGFYPADAVFYKEANGERLYFSKLLDSVWGHGRVVVGDVTRESAGYVARYCVKKVNGRAAEDHYWRVDERTGEMFSVEPEYCAMSRGGRAAKGQPGGIGAGWLLEFESDVYPRDELVVDGHLSRPPRFYDDLYGRRCPEDLVRLKKERVKRARVHAEDNTPDRLRARREVKEAQVNLLKRGFEDGG